MIGVLLVLEYDFYVSTYNGSTITTDVWGVYEQRARACLDRFKRIYRVSAPAGVGADEAESMAICAIADVEAQADIVASSELGLAPAAERGRAGASSFASLLAQAVDVTPKGRALASYRAAQLYLDIYRGVG